MSDKCKTLVKIILIMGLLCFVVGMFFIKNTLYYALGIALGTVISAARVVLLERTINKSVDMAPADAQNYARLHYSFRMVGIIAVAFAAAKIKQIDLVGFIIGLLLVQPAVYVQEFIGRKKQQD